MYLVYMSIIVYFDVKVNDFDINIVYIFLFWKDIYEDNFVMSEIWIEEFVKRRSFVVGMVIGMYWDFNVNMFCFLVLE